LADKQALHYPATHSRWFADFGHSPSGLMHYR
jgi:hypothetical protein